VINASLVVPIPDEIIEHWNRVHGLTDITPEAIAPYTKRAVADLSGSLIEEDYINAANDLVRKGAQKVGLRGEVMQHNRVDCEKLGTCLIGCPAGAKRNPRAVAIPASVAAGARYYLRSRAVRIDDANKELKRVTVRTLDPKGYHEQGSFEVRARTVILAANAIASTQLLLRSAIGNKHVGRRVSLQPQLPIMAKFSQRLDAFLGIPQAYAVTEYEVIDAEKGLGGFRIEPIMGTPGIVASLVPYAGKEGKVAMADYPHLAASLLLIPDKSPGSIEVEASGRLLMHYDQQRRHKALARDAVRAAARVYLAAGAEVVRLPVNRPLSIRSESDLSQVDALNFEPATAPWLSAHQQGGAIMGPSSKEGAVDFDGQVYGTRGVYVFDSAWFPSSASTHTMTPIIAFSHYLSERLLAKTAP
jgi:choline dehydrogenase-like flavoprotein